MTSLFLCCLILIGNFGPTFININTFQYTATALNRDNKMLLNSKEFIIPENSVSMST